MKVANRFFGIVTVSASILVAQSSVGRAQDAYSECTCVTSPVSHSGGIGQIVSSSGEVLVNNASVSSGQVLASNSEILVGEGSATYRVGSSCFDRVGANTVISISQPAGPGSNLCVSTSANETALNFQSAGGIRAEGLAVLGVAAVGVAITPFGSDAKNKRPAASD